MSDLSPEMLREFLTRTLAPPARASSWVVERVRKLVSSIITRPSAAVPEPSPAEEAPANSEPDHETMAQ